MNVVIMNAFNFRNVTQSFLNHFFCWQLLHVDSARHAMKSVTSTGKA
jgi:hypothetical protein